MTRKDAIYTLECIAVDLVGSVTETKEPMLDVLRQRIEAINMALSALRPVSREQVDKAWRGEWERITDPYGHLEGFLCKCGTQTHSASNFCPHCGGAKTDKAVQMVMERMEAMYEQKV